jgi:UDP-glucose 4-epimerase
LARILVTGAAGFIGRSLCPALLGAGHQVVAGLRGRPASSLPDGIEPRILGDVAPGRDWTGALRGIEIVVHLAQRAHRRAASAILDSEAEAAAALARSAAGAGARRFLYVSSIKAMGEATPRDRPFRPGDPAHPADVYGRAKLRSETRLGSVAAETGLELVIVRPPLVYGPAVGGNFRALLRLARSGLPLPLAGIDNRRSFLFVENLADLLCRAATHPAAAGRVLLARDDRDWSTAEMVRILAAGFGRKARLFAVPDMMLSPVRYLPFVGAATSRLTGSLQVNDAESRQLLGWHPPIPAEEGLHLTARAAIVR